MHEQTPRTLPWLERLAVHIPGYGGYLDRGNRRAADRALRDAIAARLGTARRQIEQAIRQCVDRGALTEINALERVGRHLDRVADRVRSAGSGTDRFYDDPALEPGKAQSLHQADLALFDAADALVRHFDEPDHDHDRLPHFEQDLADLERRLDERALLLQGIR